MGIPVRRQHILDTLRQDILDTFCKSGCVPFKEFSVSDQRRKLAYRVLVEGASVARAAREFGVSRQTAHLWVSRASRLESLAELEAVSRRPHHSPRASGMELREQVLCLAADRPNWGGRKIHAALCRRARRLCAPGPSSGYWRAA
jgi:transposase